MQQKIPHSKTSLQHLRWPTALIGLILMIVGQIQISRSELPTTPPTIFGQWLNDSLRLGIPNIDNILNGLPLMLIGGILLAVALAGLRLLPVEKEPDEIKPFAFRLAAFGCPGLLCAFALIGTTLWSIATREYSSWMVIGWLTSLLILIVVIAIWDQRRGANLSPGLTRQDIIWILGLAIIGLVVTAYRLQAVPDSLIGDDGNFWTAARDIASGAFKPPIFAVGVYTFPVLSAYIQAWALKLFGIDLWGWRFSSVLSGVATILPLYLLAREAFNRKVAIASSIALIFSPYFLAFSRLGYISIQALFITSLALYWLYIGLNRDSHLYLFLSGCASGLGFYTFYSARVALLICIAFIGFMWLGRKIKFRQAAFALTLLGIGTLLVASPYLVYGFNQDASGMTFKVFESAFFNTFNGQLFFSDKELFTIAPPFQINGNTLFYNPKIYLVLIVRGLIRTLLSFQIPGLITEHFISTSLTGTIGSFFFLIGLCITIWKSKQPRYLLLLLWFFSVVIGLSALNTVPPRHTHMVSIIPALALLIGIGVSAISSAASMVRVALAKYQNIFLAILITVVILGGLFDHFVLMPDKYHPQPDQIMSWAVLYAKDESFYYIYSKTEENEFRPYIATEFRRSVPFETISVDTFTQAALALNRDKSTVIFYSPYLAEKVEPILQRRWGNQYVQKTFFSNDGIPVLESGMNTPFVFVRDQSLSSIMKDSYLRPSFLIFLVVLVGIIVFTLIVPVAWTGPVPVRFKRLTEWFNGPKQPLTKEVDQALFLEAVFEQTSEDKSFELPEWAEQVFQPDLEMKPERFHAEFKRASRESGKDYYVKVHFPHIKILGLHIPENIELAFPTFHVPNPILIFLSGLLAITAQFMVFYRNSLAGIVLYLLSVSGLMVWIRMNPKWTNVFCNQCRISRGAEKLLIGVLLAVTAFIRYYDLSNRVYGLEVEETKWTILSWYSTFWTVDKGNIVSPSISMPVSLWIRSVFLHLFGLNFISPRIESASLSLLSVLFLYLLVRRLTASKPLAILSAFLYSFSFVDLNLAHQALGQTTPEVWIIGSFYFLILALQERKLWQFQVTGFLLALGMLTFDTFLPSLILAIVYLTGLGLFETIRRKSSAREWLQYLFMVVWPMILTYSFYTQSISNTLHGNDLGSLLQLSGTGSNLGGIFLFFFRNVSQLVQTIFSHVVWTDSLVNWAGPLINPLILPFVVIGFVYNLWNIRRPYFLLIPLWFTIHVAIGPISLGMVYPRVLYTVLAPLMVWGAMGLWTFLGGLRAWFDSRKFKLAVPIFCLVLIAILINDYHIFTSSLDDPSDQQKRRELADLTALSASNVPMILFPYLPNQDDTIALESNVIILSVAGGAHLEQDAENHIQQIEFSNVLTTLWEDRQLTGLDLFFDKTDILQDQRNEVLNIILNCYSGAVLSKSGRFFNVYHFDEDALSQPKCYQGTAPITIAPQNAAILLSNSPITLSWDTNGVESNSHTVTLERKTSGTYWIEVEDAFIGPGWGYASAFASDFSGKGFLLDEWQAGDAEYIFTVPEVGHYRIWIRSYKRRVNDQHNFITLDGKILDFADDSNPLNTWIWEDLGIYDLSQGQLPMTLSRMYGNDEEYSVFIDALLITTDRVNLPDRVMVWESVVNTGEVASSTSNFILPEKLSAGDYRWKVRVFDMNTLIDSNGVRGLETPLTTFKISP